MNLYGRNVHGQTNDDPADALDQGSGVVTHTILIAAHILGERNTLVVITHKIYFYHSKYIITHINVLY